MKEREKLLKEGISESITAGIETLFQVGEFTHFINWLSIRKVPLDSNLITEVQFDLSSL
jgi:hypothetical protein